jgi:NitT/TauT family transport system substrate-binding protein
MRAVVVIALGIGIVSGCKPSQKDAGPVEKITLAAFAGDTSALVYLAQEKGYFAKNGLDVTINEYGSGKLAANALLSGEADVSTNTEFVLVNHSFDKNFLRILATISIGETCSIIVRKDKGIQNESDLIGKKIGVTLDSAGEFFLARFLTFNDIRIQDVEIVNLNPSDIIEAISNGEIDVGFTWEPNIYYIQKRLGENVKTFPGQGGQGFYYILTSKEEWIETHHRAVERFLKSLIQAEKLVKMDANIVTKFLERRFQYDHSYVQDSLQKHRFEVVLPQALLLAMEDEAEWYMKNRLTNQTKIPNYLNFIHLDGLNKVKPEAITIIR